MADSSIPITSGSGTNIDTRTDSTNSNHRQVVVLGDPSINSNVAEVVNADPGPTSTAQGIIVRLAGSAQVQIAGSPGTAGVYIAGTAGTIAVGAKDGTFAVFFSPSEPTTIASGKQGTTTRPFIMNTDGAIKVYDIVNGTINTVAAVTDITNTINIRAKDGTMAVYFSPNAPTINTQSTAVISSAGGSAAGSTSAVSTSGATIVSPEASRNIKVYAFSLTTTAQVHLAAKFTQGSGASPTTLWQLALQAPSSGISGANLAVTPPGYLFAAGTGNTLSLVLDSASLVHYSVAYFKESA